MPAVVRLLESAGRSIADVEAVVVGRGPGSFTGVRIGVAAAKGMAQGLGVPLYGVGTLDAVAERFSGGRACVGVVGDAMRREVYPALFRCAAGGIERLTPDEVSTPAATRGRVGATIEEPVLLPATDCESTAPSSRKRWTACATLAPEALWTPDRRLAAARRVAGADGRQARERGRRRAAARLHAPVRRRGSRASTGRRHGLGLGNGVAGPCAAPESR